MIMSKDGGSAFPECEVVRDKFTGNLLSIGMKGGMTLRDWFAGQALAVLSNAFLFTKEDCEVAAIKAYRMADAMLAARERN
jgi:hypothetical protein